MRYEAANTYMDVNIHKDTCASMYNVNMVMHSHTGTEHTEYAD